MSKEKIVAIDFDGVIHAFRTPWYNAAFIPDGAVPGVRETLIELASDGWRVIVFTRRTTWNTGFPAVKEWLLKNLAMVEHPSGVLGFQEGEDFLPCISEITDLKPDCRVLVDDHGLQFKGDWETTLREIREFHCYRH